MLSTWIKYFVELVFSVSLFFNAMFFVPQAFKLFKLKASRELSLLTFIGFNIMQIFTAWHGYLIKDYILMGGFFTKFYYLRNSNFFNHIL